jgi:hypothetical protein
MSGLDDRLHGFRECRESGANEAQRQLRGKHFNTVIDKYWPYAARRTASAAHATGLRGNLRNYAPGSAGNEARDTDIPRRLRIRARHSWNPSVTDVIVNT